MCSVFIAWITFMTAEGWVLTLLVLVFLQLQGTFLFNASLNSPSDVE